MQKAMAFLTSTAAGLAVAGAAQDGITVGVPGHEDLDDLILPKLVAMPFRPQHESERVAREGRSFRPATHGRVFPGLS